MQRAEDCKMNGRKDSRLASRKNSGGRLAPFRGASKRVCSWPQPPIPLLTPNELAAIDASFAALEPRAPEVAQRFYANLFRLDPSTRGMFHGDMRAQGEKLTDMLAFIVRHLDDPDSLLPSVRELGIRHANYRVERSHYATVGRALLAAMGDILGAGFSAGARAAWEKAYDFLAGVMIEAAEQASARS